jgi:putative copper resistance protein D
VLQDHTYTIITFLDLLALTTLIGAAWCLMWLVRPSGPDAEPLKLVSERLYKLLGVCLPAIIISSICVLVQRSVEMSGSGIAAILPVLPTVVMKTHFGTMWLIRLAGVFVACALWWAGGRRSGSRLFASLLLTAGAVIAFTRSASSHAADFGDFSPQQLSDWLHLLAVSSWGGALLSIAAVASPAIVTEDALRQRAVAGMADRFYAFFGPVFSVLVFAGLYNARFEVGNLQALITSPYGRLLSVKLVLFLLLALRYVAPPERRRDDGLYAKRFLRRTRVEAIMVLGVLLCVAPLVHMIPARHQSHLEHLKGTGHHAGPHQHGVEPANR